MNPEDLTKFVEIAYRHGKAVADSEFDDEATKAQHQRDLRAWRKFRKEHATTAELKNIAQANYDMGYNEIKRRYEKLVERMG